MNFVASRMSAEPVCAGACFAVFGFKPYALHVAFMSFNDGFALYNLWRKSRSMGCRFEKTGGLSLSYSPLSGISSSSLDMNEPFSSSL